MSILDSFLKPSAPPVPALPDPDPMPIGVGVNDTALAEPAGVAAASPAIPANNDRLRIDARPFAPPPSAASRGLRLLPLDGFAWSGANGKPRSRGDHVLIWRPEGAGGSLHLHLPGGPVAVPAGALRYMPAGTAFALTPSPGVDGSVLLIPRDATAKLPAELPNAPVEGRLCANDTATIIATLAALGRGTDAASATCHLGLLALALGRVTPPATEAREQAAPPARRTDTATRALLDRFTTLAGNELGRGRTLGDLAAALGVTTAEIDRACRELKGCSALDLTYALRRERAIALLRETRLPPQRIALQLGFSSLGHMTRVLSLATGRGPEAFRRGV